MKTFTDNANRTWTLAINVDAIKRVKSLLDVDLMQAIDGKLIERLCDDPILLCDVIYALVKPQADAANVSDESFGQAMAGDAIDRATEAMLEDLVSFFPSQRRGLLAKVLEKLRALKSKLFAASSLRLDTLDLDKITKAAMDELDRRSPGVSSTNSPASSESTPAP